MEKCERCGKENCGLIMSMFNTQMICFDCKEREKKRPDYREAVRRECEEVRKGNYNFKGLYFDG